MAVSTISTGNLSTVIASVKTVVTMVLGLAALGVTILALVIAYKFFTASDDAKRKNAKSQLIYAIVGVIVLVVLIALVPTITSLITEGTGNFILNF